MVLKSDENLVKAVKDGCIDSFGCLYKQYYNSIAALAYSVTGDKNLAQDAAQETFAIACQRIIGLKDNAKFGAWLAGICRNVAKQMLKQKQKLTLHNNLDIAKDDHSTDNHDETVKKIVWQLRAFDREVVVLRYYDGLSYEKISQTLGISQQAVNGRLLRAKKKIEKQLKKQGITGVNYETS